jgi:hypothetical protein
VSRSSSDKAWSIGGGKKNRHDVAQEQFNVAVPRAGFSPDSIHD